MNPELCGRSCAPLRGRDPGALLLAAFGAAVCFSLLRGMAVSCIGLALALLLAALGGQSPSALLKRLVPANFFIFFLWLTVPLTMAGANPIPCGPLQLSREGLALALSVTVKCNAILLCLLALLAGLSLPQIGCSLERLRVPPKLVFLFLFTCRYIHVIGQEWRKLQTAALLRGFVPRTSLHTYRTVGNMLGLTVINSLDRSRRIYEAMLLRGFEGQFQTAAEGKATRGDVAFTACFFLLLLCLLAADIALGLRHV
jgi:cobalt/nickel transport system permease protein